MLHRTALGALLAVTLSAGAGQAAAPAKSGGSTDSQLNLAIIGLPVIVEGKVKNYVFVQTRLLPGPGADLIKLREKEPYYRDALVRAAHRTPFTVAGDWTVLDEARLEAVLLAEARRISGPRSFSRADLLKQTPRRRTGFKSARAH